LEEDSKVVWVVIELDVVVEAVVLDLEVRVVELVVEEMELGVVVEDEENELEAVVVVGFGFDGFGLFRNLLSIVLG
jgi:hypothetical protein